MPVSLIRTKAPKPYGIEHAKFLQHLGTASIAAYILEKTPLNPEDISIVDCVIDSDYENTIRDISKTEEPLIVGIYTTTYSYPMALNIAKMIKDEKPDAHINLGGYHATKLPELILLNRSDIDSVIRGDGEVPFAQLVDALNGDYEQNEIEKRLSKVGSLTYRKKGEIKSNELACTPELDDLPWPARDILSMNTYFENLEESRYSKQYGGTKEVAISVSRGCPGYNSGHQNRHVIPELTHTGRESEQNENIGCGYCSIYNRGIRTRSPESIKKEIEYLKDTYDADIFYLVGDNLNWNRKWLQEVSDTIRPLDIKWIQPSGNPYNLDKSLLASMEDSGCISTLYGMESGSKEILKNMGRKPVSKDNIELIRNSNLHTCLSFVLGYEGENEDTIEETIQLADKINPEVTFGSIVVPLPGTRIYKDVCKKWPELTTMDIFPVEEATDRYNEDFCKVDIDALNSYQKLLMNTAKISSFDVY